MTHDTQASPTEKAHTLKCGVCFERDGRRFYATVCKIYQHRELAQREIDRERNRPHGTR